MGVCARVCIHDERRKTNNLSNEVVCQMEKYCRRFNLSHNRVLDQMNDVSVPMMIALSTQLCSKSQEVTNISAAAKLSEAQWNRSVSEESNKRPLLIRTAGGGVLLVEALLHEDGSGPLTVQLYSLNMLVQTEGRERTAAQYAALLAAAGFTAVRHRLTGKIYDAVLGRKEG